jgi:hypothetical protein
MKKWVGFFISLQKKMKNTSDTKLRNIFVYISQRTARGQMDCYGNPRNSPSGTIQLQPIVQQ